MKTQVILLSLLWIPVTRASPSSQPPAITFLPSRYAPRAALPETKILPQLRALFGREPGIREIRAQPIYGNNWRIEGNAHAAPDHLLVYLLARDFHHCDLAKVNLDSHFRFLKVEHPYRWQPEDVRQQPGIEATRATCPDDTVEFIAFCPNDDQLEKSTTVEVAKAAESHGLKTVQLLVEQATRENYLNYLMCPGLKGNFYDGDANPDMITTSDGGLSASDVQNVLKNQFKYWVTNIWVACQAYNNPLLSAMIDVAQSKKYAAGINNLAVGPSDKAAACAMEAALDGTPMTQAFNDCYTQHDTSGDHWGFGGNGPDLFYWNPPPGG